MCIKEIVELTIKEIEKDILEIRIELIETPIYDSFKIAQLKSSIAYAEEIIEELKQEKI